MARQTKTQQSKQIRFDDRFEKHEPVLDAEFETIAAVPKSALKKAEPVAPVEVAGTKQAADTIGKEKLGKDKIGMSVFGKKPGKPLRDDSIAFYGFSAALVLLSFWVSGGHALFAQIDRTVTGSIQSTQTAAEIIDPAWRVITVDGRSALHVEGVVRNSSTAAVHSGPVTVTVKHEDGSTKRYILGRKGWTLGASQEVVVTGRLDIASASVASVVMSLAN